jgi:hypothetical protein
MSARRTHWATAGVAAAVGSATGILLLTHGAATKPPTVILEHRSSVETTTSDSTTDEPSPDPTPVVASPSPQVIVETTTATATETITAKSIEVQTLHVQTLQTPQPTPDPWAGWEKTDDGHYRKWCGYSASYVFDGQTCTADDNPATREHAQPPQ